MAQCFFFGDGKKRCFLKNVSAKPKENKFDNRRKKWIVQHTEENEKLSIENCLGFSTKFKRSITAQCVTNTIAKKAEILRPIQAMAQTNNLNLRKDQSARINEVSWLLFRLNLTYEIKRLTGLESGPVSENPKVQFLKFLPCSKQK